MVAVVKYHGLLVNVSTCHLNDLEIRLTLRLVRYLHRYRRPRGIGYEHGQHI
jgi:hypothetical protein